MYAQAFKTFLQGKEVKTVKLSNGGEAKVVEHNGREIVVGASFRSGPLLRKPALANA
jgi:hypothetical protein